MKKNLLLLVVLSLLTCFTFTPCLSQNPIADENDLTGNPASEWDISGAGDLSIQGFATNISINTGSTIDFKIDVKAPATNYAIKIYRLGYYDGAGAREITDLGNNFPGVAQPAPLYETATGKTDCSNWSVSASWTATDAVSGIYLAKLTRNDNSGSSHIAFVVRDDAGNADILFKTSDATWQAYNGYGGNSLYVNNSGTPVPGFNHATKVSYNRPFYTRSGGGGSGSSEDWLFNAEYPMIRWLERNGYDVSYTTDVDMDRDPTVITTSMHKILLSIGHDEYWSAAERTAFETARGNGVHLAFFSGNEVYWKTRWEDNHRTLVCYKEGTQGENVCGGDCDPSNIWTGLWRDGCASNAPDGCNPENALTGQISWGDATGSILVPDTYKNLRFWRNTSIASLNIGQTATLPNGTLGYEFDFEQYFDTYPGGRITLSNTTLSGKNHKMSLYRHSSGALVFGAGTVQWSWGLDSNHDRGNAPPSLDMQQATVNLFADMGVQPVDPHDGLVAANISTDNQAPTSVIANPLDGATLPLGGGVMITGTATDAGGVVAGVEVSLDGGGTWQPASGTTNWTFNWTPAVNGAYVIKSRAFDDSGNIEPAGTAPAANAITVNVSGTIACPCSLFQVVNAPATPNGNDGQGIAVGMRFQSAEAGFITAIRYYKGSSFTGVRTGHLWNDSGTQLAAVTFSGESASGWQQANLSAAVAINANETYIVGYHSPSGHYGYTDNYFTAAVPYGPLTALADNAPGAPNGIYAYTSTPVFPTQTFQASNYWVDVVFETSVGPDLAPPAVIAIVPANGASGVSNAANITATFNEDLNPATVGNSTFELRDPGNNLVAATVTYSGAARTATLDPSANLQYSTLYTATLTGGISGISDVAGNPLAADYSWSFTTAAAPPPPPTEGPGGPVLVISAAANPFSRYPVEILRAEGWNEFFAMDISAVTAAVLNDYDVVILGEMTLTASDVTMLTDWVNAGGTLIAFKPYTLLFPLMGITAAPGSLSDQYILIQTGSGPGVGLVNETIQFHGTADYYNLTGASALATLYSNATTPTIYPAVTTNNVGPNGGKAIAFAYDLAKSIVYTRQGNPDWAGQSRDGQAGPIRADNLFFPDYIDFNKVDIPQADEQQRLLSNIMLKGNLHRKPLPRFWFLPRKLKAAVVMTGDDHASGGTIGRFNQYLGFGNNTPQDVLDWKAIRGTSYIYSSTSTGTISNAQAAAFEAQGFEIAAHITTNCGNWSSQSDLDNSIYTPQLAEFAGKWPGVPAPSTNRTHCIAWSDWASQPKVEASKGIRLDCNYYYWPGSWIQNRAGMFTGSGMPMRFADLDGTLIDCYQVTTQMPDESDITWPGFINTLLDNAIGTNGYYGVFCANMHTDNNNPGDQSVVGSDAIIASAIARDIPVVSARQMLNWLDGRNGSSFDNISWNTNALSFEVSVGSGAHNLYGMLPVDAANGQLLSLTHNSNNIAYTTEIIKGINYAFFPAAAGAYVATYGVDMSPPVISNVVATPHSNGTATITWTTDEPADSSVHFDDVPDPLAFNTGNAALVTNHMVLLTGLLPNTAYFFRVLSQDANSNSAIQPNPPAAPLSFTMANSICAQDQTATDFNLGTPDANTAVTVQGDGDIVLKPVLIEDFSGAGVPAGWTDAIWDAQGGAVTTFSGGQVTVDGTHLSYNTSVGPGTSLEFVATFTAGNFQNIGFTGDAAFNNPWIVIGRGSPGDNGVYARTSDNQSALLGTTFLGAPHTYRIHWLSGTNTFEFYVDGVLIPTPGITQTVGTSMIIQISDYPSGGVVLSVDWLRATPYAASGSYTSRVFDQGAANGWGIATWTASLPVGTTLSLLARTGNTAVPDGTWTAFLPLTNGAPVGGSNRYLQYRADLATGNNLFTPVLEDISIECGTGPDLDPPVISNVQAVPAPDGLSATISWDTDELANSLVQYGTNAGNLNGSVSGAAFVLGHSLVISGLIPGTTYYYRVTSTDPGNNTDIEPQPPGTLSFTMPVPPCFFDWVPDDFAQGTFSSTYLSLDDDGVILKPTAAAEFSVLPPTGEWQSFAWTGGTSTVSGGVLTVDGARFNSQPVGTTFSPGATLEFVATFGAANFQHVGFGGGTDATGSGGIYNGESDLAMFSTFNTGGAQLYARTKSGPSEVNILIPGSYIGTSHRYRIEWNAGTVLFYIDGALVHTETVSIASTMRPAISDYNNGGPVLQVDWIHATPYAASGTFTSRVYDAGGATNWEEVSWIATVPVGTTLQLYQRQGNTPVPDGSWTVFTLIPSNGADIGGTSRYIQYRADFTSSNTAVTPLLQEIEFDCSACTTAAATLSNNSVGNTICAGAEIIFTAGPADAINYEFFVDNISVQTGASNTFASSALTNGAGVHVIVTDENNCNISSSSFTQSSSAQFNEGTSGVCSIWEVGDGEITLAPAEGSLFDGGTIPVGWSSTPWAGGGASSVAGGQVTVDGALLVTDAFYPAGRVIEFVATFGAATFQHAGFGVDVNNSPNWAMFSTQNSTTQLFARTNNNGTATSQAIAGSYIGTPHRYRIEWDAGAVRFYIDGSLVHTENVSIGANMRPLVSDLSVGGAAISVNWMRMTPYASPCSYDSKVFDAGSVASWGIVNWLSNEPVGTSVAVSVRTGNTPVPDGTWTAFGTLANGGSAASSGRYAQYRAVLQTSDPDEAPRLEQISLVYSIVVTFTANSGVQNITVNTAPTSSNAGPDQTIASPDATLAGNTPVIGTGAWTLVNGSATITDPASPTSTLSGIALNTSVTLRWTITNGDCSSFDEVTISRQSVQLRSRIFWEGPYAGANLMNDHLRAGALLPASEPYTGLGFTHVGGGAENAQVGVFNMTGNNAIVDWAFIELRDKNNPALVLATRSVLVQADGDIVDMDGTSDVSFSSVPSDQYYIVIRHRNHLGIRTLNAISLSAIATMQDFSDGSIDIVLTTSQKDVSGTLQKWSGDANVNSTINAVDRSEVWNNRNQAGYRTEDMNMDGNINAPDRALTWNNRNKSSTY